MVKTIQHHLPRIAIKALKNVFIDISTFCSPYLIAAHVTPPNIPANISRSAHLIGLILFGMLKN
jgi:hypothetical protein